MVLEILVLVSHGLENRAVSGFSWKWAITVNLCTNYSWIAISCNNYGSESTQFQSIKKWSIDASPINILLTDAMVNRPPNGRQNFCHVADSWVPIFFGWLFHFLGMKWQYYSQITFSHLVHQLWPDCQIMQQLWLGADWVLKFQKLVNWCTKYLILVNWCNGWRTP